ncbi:VWA domain-containing protein [Telmatobacter bradus]|uniref:VWA domain-containing protein n=1 Tax=Telmatobacter bradus TaxID=474953 RepID=UPI003B42FEF7
MSSAKTQFAERSYAMIFFSTLIVLCGTLLLDCTAAAAQQADAPESSNYSIKVETRRVLLDVLVTDAKGKVVTNLKADDFHVYEENVEQPVRTFDAPQVHEIPKKDEILVRSTEDLPKIGSAPVTLIVLDELNTSFEDMAYARNQVKSYLKAQPAILRQPTTLLAANNTHFQVIKDYTQDRAALLTALDKHFPEYPWKMQHSGANSAGAFERMGMSLNSLNEMADASRGTPGRKTVIWVGKGFPAVSLIGLDEHAAGLMQDAIKRLTSSLMESRITLYTIDPSSTLATVGKVSSSDDLESMEMDPRNDGVPFSDEINFTTLAPVTGGQAFFSRNDIDAEVADSTILGASYYTLTYAPTGDSEKSAPYRHIRIKMSDPNLKAVTRDGYYSENPIVEARRMDNKTPQQARSELEAEMGKAAFSSLPYNGLDVKLERGKGDEIQLKIAAGTLQWADSDSGNLVSEITVLYMLATNKGKIVGHGANELNATAQGRAQTQDQRAVFTIHVPAAADAARLRVVARDARSGKIGTADMVF